MADNPTRRGALKALAAATGAVTLASLPTRWAKPTLSVGAIPAHAQTSPGCPITVTAIGSDGGSLGVNWGHNSLPSSADSETSGANSYEATWDCGRTGTDCIAFGTGPVTVTVTIRTQSQILVDTILTDDAEAYSIDLATGVITVLNTSICPGP